MNTYYTIKRHGFGVACDVISEKKKKKQQLTELVADQEPEPAGPGVVGLEAGVGHGPSFLAADAELRRAGRHDHDGEAGESQTYR